MAQQHSYLDDLDETWSDCGSLDSLFRAWSLALPSICLVQLRYANHWHETMSCVQHKLCLENTASRCARRCPSSDASRVQPRKFRRSISSNASGDAFQAQYSSSASELACLGVTTKHYDKQHPIPGLNDERSYPFAQELPPFLPILFYGGPLYSTCL